MPTAVTPPDPTTLLYVAPPDGVVDSTPTTLLSEGGGTAENALATNTIPPDVPWPWTQAERDLVEAVRQAELEAARQRAIQDRDNHIREVIASNPNWSDAQKAAVTDAVLRLAHAADSMTYHGRVGLNGECYRWVDEYMRATEQLRAELDRLGNGPWRDEQERSLPAGPFVKVEQMYWDNHGVTGDFYALKDGEEGRPGHAAVRITLPDGTVFYLDDTYRGGSDHMFGPGEVPGHYRPSPNTPSPTPPAPWW